MLKLGEKIRELRKQAGRTQEDLARALGVTCQAISRWEANGGYPDMEIMPAIANYFGVSIDELFGYHGDRARKIDAIIEKIRSMQIDARGDDLWIEDAIDMLREGLAEFPQNEKLLILLAEVLASAGWRKHKEHLYYDAEGYIRHDADLHQKNPYWIEAVKVCENLVGTVQDVTIKNRAIYVLVLLYRNLGENKKAILYAQQMPSLASCKEMLLTASTDGREQAGYIGELLLLLADTLAEQTVYALVSNERNFESDLPINKLQGVIGLFGLLCEDEHLGEYHRRLVELYLYLSRVQWERNYHEEAFVSLSKALKHARTYDALLDEQSFQYTAPLLCCVQPRLITGQKITKALADSWPVWSNPDYSQVEKEMKADPRWATWVRKTQM